ncbi:MAG TPA: cytochrome P460 family protein [Phenylobacterium sp.]|nr:cytochrome P460 family protein [Phenylobacterium sp.]
MRFRIGAGATALGVAVMTGLAATAVSHAQSRTPAVAYTADGKLQYPKDYRTWVYLTSGMDMSYSENAGGGDHHMFDNVFVNREAYEAFQKTGTWPDKTIFMLEARMAEPKASINKQGLTQTAVMGREAHVKDTKRFASGWAFFPFTGEGTSGPAFPQTSNCNQCHEQHGAVDTTFVQFYPTLQAKAQEKKTFSAAYLAEEAKAKDEKR